MNNYRIAAIALAAFALGIALDEVRRVAASHAGDAVSPASVAAASGPMGHPAVGERSLEDAVFTTVSFQRGGPVQRSTAASPASTASTAPSSADPLVRADELRRARKFTEAVAAYARAVEAGHMDADAWADYADSLASANASFKGPAAEAIAKALALDPRHPKALWLKASSEHEEQHYREAARTWQTLLAVVPANSSDAKIIQANIAEANRLAASQG